MRIFSATIQQAVEAAAETLGEYSNPSPLERRKEIAQHVLLTYLSIIKLAVPVFSVEEPPDSTEAGGPSDPDLVRDAMRWRALLGSKRIHASCQKGFSYLVNQQNQTLDVREVLADHSEPQTVTVEFYSYLHEHGDERYPDTFDRSILTAYADAQVARLKKDNHNG